MNHYAGEGEHVNCIAVVPQGRIKHFRGNISFSAYKTTCQRFFRFSCYIYIDRIAKISKAKSNWFDSLYEDIRALDIPVDDPLRMHTCECLSYLCEDLTHLILCCISFLFLSV